ncbi:potassium transporter Kup [Azospirillum rugosum]|uniref:Probable potassium transport system protein Kup n=1 Tax=Azospirillum rugosum TaxID=416170 RepID=A0ABS4SLX2_9PROT|nr:potassium transporter Kup [Azospirillum rugosum]MBP2293566.1 KUP system potassium uptake protein [Azospirillum rugosum]MDQ0529245.1 KUP system potassium uptake protein [Azospirillum rugosum]
MSETPLKAAAPDTGKLAALTLGALGVVYGDIGTSPLYTLRECFSPDHGLALTPENIMGIMSLVFWALVIIVTVKYVLFVMRADNKGEGGILALLALATSSRPDASGRLSGLMAMGLFGAALFYGDGMITPAVSVLGAVEGLEVAEPALESIVVPVTVCILIALFAIQSRGTDKVGKLFGPIMVVWFVTLGILGLIELVQQPRVLMALNPAYGVAFFQNNGWVGFLVLGAVVLAVTGGEALYADMGHFGRHPIKVAWLTVVLPSLLLNYLGQCALLLSDPEAVRSPFYLLVPEWGLYPMILLSTCAAVIASQAVISGVFSLTRQAVQLGLCPRLDIRHTSSEEGGQIYIPRANWGLLIAIIGLVVWFGSSSRLATAYGIAVTGDMCITTVLALVVAHRRWGWSVPVCITLGALFLSVELSLFAANAVKIPHGGWVPLAIAAAALGLMSTWRRGRAVLAHRLAEESLPLDSFIKRHAKSGEIQRVKGTAVFMTSGADTVPMALLHNLKHNQVMHERIVFLTVVVEDVPRVPAKDRVLLEGLAEGFYRLTVRYGFSQEPNIPKALRLCKAFGLEFDVMTTSFFLGRETLIPRINPHMALWREKLFVVMSRTAVSATDFFKIPPNRVVELGTQVQL